MCASFNRLSIYFILALCVAKCAAGSGSWTKLADHSYPNIVAASDRFYEYSGDQRLYQMPFGTKVWTICDSFPERTFMNITYSPRLRGLCSFQDTVFLSVCEDFYPWKTGFLSQTIYSYVGSSMKVFSNSTSQECRTLLYHDVYRSVSRYTIEGFEKTIGGSSNDSTFTFDANSDEHWYVSQAAAFDSTFVICAGKSYVGRGVLFAVKHGMKTQIQTPSSVYAIACFNNRIFIACTDPPRLFEGDKLLSTWKDLGWSGDTILSIMNVRNQLSGATAKEIYTSDELMDIRDDHQFSESTSLFNPNPAHDILHFDQEVDEVEIYDCLGQRVLFSGLAEISHDLDIHALPSGTYLVRCAHGGRITSSVMLHAQ